MSSFPLKPNHLFITGLRRTCSFVFILVLGLILLGIPEKSLAMVDEVALEDLVNGADLILVGDVQNITSGPTQITATVAVDGTPIKGIASGTLSIVSGPILMYDASFTRVPERVLLFLIPEASDFRAYGGNQGKYTIEDGHVLELGISEQQFISDIDQILSGP